MRTLEISTRIHRIERITELEIWKSSWLLPLRGATIDLFMAVFCTAEAATTLHPRKTELSLVEI